MITQHLKDIQSYSEQLQAQINGGSNGHELQEIASGIANSASAALAESGYVATPIPVVEPEIEHEEPTDESTEESA
jgi:hypothetical protein